MDLGPAQYENLAAFRRALRQFLAFSEAVTRDAGVTAQQYQALLAIKARPGEATCVKDLADELLLQHNAAVQLVNRLADAGLAERTPSAKDRRIVLLSLTDKGQRVLATLAKNHLAELLSDEPLLVETLTRLRRLAAA